MEEQVEFTSGGTLIVIVGVNGYVQEFATHPQVKFIETKNLNANDLMLQVPDNTKLFILGDGVLPPYHNWVMDYTRKHRIPWLSRKTNQQVYDALTRYFPNGKGNKPTVEEVRETEIKGKLNVFVEHINFTKSNIENARVLLKLANEKNIKTTEASLAQFVAVQRRKSSGTGIVKSARPKLDVSVDLLDAMIHELTDMREFLIATTEENRMLRMKLEKFKKVFEGD